MINLFDILKSQGELKHAYVYPAITHETDPVEHTTEDTLLDPVIVQGILKDISFGGLKYKYFGELNAGSKQLLCDKKYLSLLKICRKIIIDSEEYAVYQDADKNFQILSREDYLVVIIQRV